MHETMDWRDGSRRSARSTDYALLAQDWCRQALKAVRKRVPRTLSGFEQWSRMTVRNDWRDGGAKSLQETPLFLLVGVPAKTAVCFLGSRKTQSDHQGEN